MFLHLTMKTIFKYVILLLFLISPIIMLAQNGFAQHGYKSDSFTTPQGRIVNLIFIKHGSVALDIDGFVVYVDPVTMFGNDLSILPKADMLLVTHEHHDHYDPKAIQSLSTNETMILASPGVAKMCEDAEPFSVGDKFYSEAGNFTITGVPAYNNTSDHLNFHPQSRGDLGFVFNIDGLKIYVAGDTEDIVEMQTIGDEGVDIVFVPVNQPYTMTVNQAIHAIEMLRPKIVYPYHYGQTDLVPLINHFEGSEIDLRLRDME